MARVQTHLFTACSALIAATLLRSAAAAQDVAGVKAAETYARTVLGDACDMNGMTDVTVNPPEPAGQSHYTYAFTYRYAYQGSDEPEQKAELYQIFCSSGAYNISHAFILKTGDPAALQLVSFPQPALKYDYADDEQARLKSPPLVIGYAGQSKLVNATYDPAIKTITSHAAWRGIGDAWDTGEWAFEDGGFMLKKFAVDPTYDGGQKQTEPESYVVFQAP